MIDKTGPVQLVSVNFESFFISMLRCRLLENNSRFLSKGSVHSFSERWHISPGRTVLNNLHTANIKKCRPTVIVHFRGGSTNFISFLIISLSFKDKYFSRTAQMIENIFSARQTWLPTTLKIVLFSRNCYWCYHNFSVDFFYSLL